MIHMDHSRIQANLRHIAQHEAKPNPKPLPYTTITRGFEAVAYPKIVRELKDNDLIVKQKSLLAARELLGVPTSYMQCIAAGITPAVVALLQDDDPIVRERAAGTMEYLATKEVGARDIKQHGGVPLMVSLLKDSALPVRDAAYKALIEAARFNPIREALVEEKTALPLLMKLALEEEHGRSLRGLILLNACVQVRHNKDALTQLVDHAKAIPALTALISEDKSPEIQEHAAKLLGLCASTFQDAKIEAVQVGAVPKLLALLDQPSILLASTATTALMMITVVNDAKYAVVNTKGGIEALVKWLDPANEQLCINAMECISNVAEAPEARPLLAEGGAFEKLSSIHGGPYPEGVKSSAAQAMRQCKFKCLPFAPLPGR
mmetsp:Transcript_35054/g.78025  ORF Transcript_35054/g.78025 Transcript_35054/m.78025 type:complete len:377 (-) Transcript_35054:404-1534(-)